MSFASYTGVDIMALTSGQFVSLTRQSFQELLSKDLERIAVISWILTAWKILKGTAAIRFSE